MKNYIFTIVLLSLVSHIKTSISVKTSNTINFAIIFFLLCISFCPVAIGQCLDPLRDGNFQGQRSSTPRGPWVKEGRAGIDVENNNAWVRNTSGWNAIRQQVRLNAGVNYTLKAKIRTSANVRDGYFGFRNAAQGVVREIKFGPVTTFREFIVQFRPSQTANYNVFAGFHAPNADAWIEIDYVRIQFPCNDVITIPAED